jgi:hypothetical protein
MVVQAGRIVDAADYTPGLGLGISDYVVKPTNESLSSSTTFQADNDLVLALAAGTYEVEVFLIVTGPAAADIKTAWTVPSGATGSRLCIGPTSVAASFTGQAETQARMSAHGWGTSVSYSIDTAAVAIVERGPLVVTTAGTLTLTWAQVTTNATATVVGTNSYLKVTRIA